jgi:hypothetical protein
MTGPARQVQVLAPEDLPPIATAAQVAKVVQTTVDALAQDRYRRRGIPHVKIGGRVRYLRSDVLKFLADNRIGGDGDVRVFIESCKRGGERPL